MPRMITNFWSLPCPYTILTNHPASWELVPRLPLVRLLENSRLPRGIGRDTLRELVKRRNEDGGSKGTRIEEETQK